MTGNTSRLTEASFIWSIARERSLKYGLLFLLLAGAVSCKGSPDEPAGETTACSCQIETKTPTPEEPLTGMVWVPAGSAKMGVKPLFPEEHTTKQSKTAGFWMSPHEVTIAQFARFIEATGYITSAERTPKAEDNPGIAQELLVPGGAVFTSPKQLEFSSGNQWSFVAGANWRKPSGVEVDPDCADQLPVTQVSIEDARAYADWLSHDLPTEEEWEYAALGGTQGQMFPWGDTLTVHGEHQANYWQGQFPVLNTVDDGYAGVAPIGCFPANGYGLYDMIGNTWELVETGFSPNRDRVAENGAATIKGGSFLCSESFCGRFRPSARQPQARDFTTNHVGFRTIRRPD